uniref:PsbP C-terminal domain-containing protein n=1 Tax=Craspedostauros australis TaxID=1486917 RepID=A0A7R9ZSX9_9STRA|mmetsp:Transcript_9238/g.24955  ORF Transcript_9238/g.24955 Transcript_9238/m.24955 type:complete len:239 (+) Transcript_9238:85-801(+)
MFRYSLASAVSVLLLLAADVNGYSASNLPAVSSPNALQSGLDDETSKITRRGWLSSTAGLVVGAAAFAPSAFAEDDLKDYKDPDCKFSIKVPAGWDFSEQELADRRKIKLYLEPNSNRKTLFFMAFTPVRDDFTSLGSFGSVDQVAQTTILPKGKIMGEENSSTMLSAESKNSAYFFDYKQKVSGQPETHFRTIFSLANGATGGAGAVLVSLTAQCPEADYDAFKPLFDSMMTSYKAK